MAVDDADAGKGEENELVGVATNTEIAGEQKVTTMKEKVIAVVSRAAVGRCIRKRTQEMPVTTRK